MKKALMGENSDSIRSGKQLMAIIEKEVDGSYIAYNYNIDLLYVVGNGETIEEAKKSFLSAREELKKSYQQKGGTPAKACV